MDWQRYKRLCSQPNVFSRWMLVQTLELMDDDAAAMSLKQTLAHPPIRKPANHKGEDATDMFALDLAPCERDAVLGRVRRARDSGRTTSYTKHRGLGGFVEAWQEYADWRVSS